MNCQAGKDCHWSASATTVSTSSSLLPAGIVLSSIMILSKTAPWPIIECWLKVSTWYYRSHRYCATVCRAERAIFGRPSCVPPGKSGSGCANLARTYGSFEIAPYPSRLTKSSMISFFQKQRCLEGEQCTAPWYVRQWVSGQAVSLSVQTLVSKLGFSVPDNISVQELSLLQSSKHFPESLCQAAQILADLHTKFFSETQTQLLLRESANVAPVELSQQTDLPPERRKQAAALVAQAATVAGAVACCAGDTTTLPWPGDCLTSGKVKCCKDFCRGGSSLCC